jgi:two-component system, CitB family, response regulator DctR
MEVTIMTIKVLIVEDDPIVVEVTKEFLKEDSEFEVVGVAVSGSEAVDLYVQVNPNLILLDNFLPDFNGITVIEKIRSLNKTVDFIMITAAKEVPVVQECLRLGIRDYLIKPYLKQRLIQALNNYKQFYKTLYNQDQFSQADLDRLASTQNDNLPEKGFSRLTEEKIIELLKTKTSGVTAEEIALEIGITTVSSRRYLKLLLKKEAVTFDLIYGKQGRPTFLYSIK